MRAALSPEKAHLRFFGLSPLNAERQARRVCREPPRMVRPRPNGPSDLRPSGSGGPGAAHLAGMRAMGPA